jgi:signal peptidase I
VSPLELFALICVFAIVRLALSIKVGVLATVPEGTQNARTVIREYLDAFIVAGLVALFLITFVVRTFYIPSGSMEPTLQVHDVLLVNEFEYRFTKPHDGDIVVFEPPIPSSNDFIKRLMGSPGDTLRIHNGIVIRNGVALNEPYEAQKPNYELEIKNYGIYVDGSKLDPELSNVPPKSAWQAPDRIPEGYYFMMGDNRNNSEDSHIWGFAESAGKKSWFVGHAFLLFWPLNRVGILR